MTTPTPPGTPASTPHPAPVPPNAQNGDSDHTVRRATWSRVDRARDRTTAGPTTAWSPTWSPRDTADNPTPDADLPPLTVVHDACDDYAFMAAALAAHDGALGRITVHPTPVASAPAALAHDVLRSLGKHLPLAGSEDSTYWTGSTEITWRAVAAWIFALHIGHVIVTRTHRISSRHFEHLFALRELTGIRLTLLCHGPLPPALAAALPHEEVHTLAAARRAVSAPAPAPPADRYAWWEAGEHFPPRPGEPCFLMPTRRTPGRSALEAAARRLERTVLPLPAAGRFPPEPDEHTSILAHRLHARVAHPVHAAALAVRVLTGCSAAQLRRMPAAHPATKALWAADRELRPPSWAADLIESARRFRQLEGQAHSTRLLRLSTWDQVAVAEAAGACGLFEYGGQARARVPAALHGRT